MAIIRYPRQNLLWIIVFTVSSLWYSMTFTALQSRDISDLLDSINLPAATNVTNVGNETKLKRMLPSKLQAGFNDRHSHSIHHEDEPRSSSSRDPSQQLSQDTNATALALLYPSGLIGGYRNQAMRFIALVRHAMDRNITQLLLPSLLWSTRYHNQFPIFFWPVPFEELFDVGHWNSYHHYGRTQLQQDESSPTRTTSLQSTDFSPVQLPRLVEYIPDSDCWRTDTISADEAARIRQRLYSDDFIINNESQINSTSPTTPIRNGKWFIPKLTEKVVTTSAVRLRPTADVTVEFLSGKLGTAFRKMNFQDQVLHCRHPQFHGGGYSAGVLWNEYLDMPKMEPGKDQHNAKPETIHTTNLIATIHRALIPALKWRQLAHQCIRHHLNESGKSDESDNGYVVLHARVETEMMVHKCGREMEKNLTTLFDMVDGFMERYNAMALPPNRLLHGTMVAVGREGMQEYYAQVVDMAEHNWKTLNERSISYVNGTYTLQSQRHLDTYAIRSASRNNNKLFRTSISSKPKLPVFECGEGWVEQAFYKDSRANQEHLPINYYGSILPSILNFWLAVEADVFVGVMKSSWSTDVWTTRFYFGKGGNNFQYTAENGIIPVPHGGLPPSHKNC